MEIMLHPAVGSLFKLLLQPNKNTKLFLPNAQSMELINDAGNFIQDMLTTCIATRPTSLDSINEDRPKWEDTTIKVCVDEAQHHYKPHTNYHYALGLPSYQFDIDANHDEEFEYSRGVDVSYEAKHLMVEDDFGLWMSSRTNDLARTAPSHLIAIEQMYSAVLPGGYFGCVLPKKWLGNRKRFMKWFNNNAGLVAKVRLPSGSLLFTKFAGKKFVPVTGEWFLYLWLRSVGSLRNPSDIETRFAPQLEHATLRYPTFVHTLTGLGEESVERAARLFRSMEWWQNSVTIWNDLVSPEGELGFKVEYGTHGTGAYGIEKVDPESVLKPIGEYKLGYKTVDSISKAQSIPMCCLIVPGRKIKLRTFELRAAGALIESYGMLGYEFNRKTGMSDSRFQKLLSTMSFYEAKEMLLSTLMNVGLQPVMLTRDESRVVKQERWLDRQLTPIERYVRIKNGEDGETSWDKLYEDIGLESTQSMQMDQWRQRAKKMGLDKLAFGFQGWDICAICTKDGVLNSNQMGLGKTLESLMVALLRTVDRVLIVCPGKLIQEWKMQLDDTINRFARRQMRDWRGKRLDVSYNIIRCAEDCKPANLARFNIISYELLSHVPTDSMYFICKCKNIVCSPKKHPVQYCPACTEKAASKWRKDCATNGFRKRIIGHEPSGKMIVVNARFWDKDDNINVSKLERFLESRGVEFSDNVAWTVDDQRPPKPQPVSMTITTNRYKKVQKKIDKKTPTETVVVNGIQVVRDKFKWVERSPHLKWSYSELLRHQFGMIVCDEALYIKNEETNRAAAVNHLCSPTRIVLTGTPIKGLPFNILNILNWATRRLVFPDYRSEDDGSRSYFLKKFASYVKIVNNDGTVKKKMLPKVSNPELFQQEIAPIMLRHVRTEKVVTDCIPIKEKIYYPDDECIVEMDDKHRYYYGLFLEKFAEWWAAKRREEEGVDMGESRDNILAKISWLIGASTIPHKVFETLKSAKTKTNADNEAAEWARKIGFYRGPATAKQMLTLSLVNKARMIGDKILISAIRRQNLIFGNKWCNDKGIPSLIITGDVSTAVRADGTSIRSDMIASFRNQSYVAMWAGLTCMSEGVNIPEANRVVVMDYDWDPAPVKQFLGRVDRPQQKKTIHYWLLAHKGTIEEYMRMITELKMNSSDESIDYMEFGLTTEMIPDIRQYADWIVDGTEGVGKAKMQLAIDEIRKKRKEEGEE